MSVKHLTLSASDTHWGRRDYLIEYGDGASVHSEMIYMLGSLVEEIQRKTQRSQVQVTFRAEVLIIFDKHDGQLHRRTPLTSIEQDRVWEELCRRIPDKIGPLLKVAS